MMTGSAPLSPLRTRRSQTRVYSPSDPASTSGAAVSAISAAAPSGSPATATPPGWSWAVSPLSGDDIPQPSEPVLTLPEAADSLPLPLCRRADAPVVIRSTTDAVS